MAVAKRILWSPAAREDIDRIWLHLRTAASKQIADAFYSGILRAAMQIAEFPNLSRQRDDLTEGSRTVVVKPYLMIFRQNADRIEIVRVVHGRQNYPAILRRRNVK